MTYEDIACMSPDDAEKTIKDLLGIVAVVAIIGEGVPLKKNLVDAARKYL